MPANDSQTAAIDNEIAHLRGLDLDGLRARWRSLTGRTAPPHLSRMLLLRVLAYRVQAAALGDLDKTTARLLDRIADEARSGKPVEVPVPDRVGLRPGTLLVREWEGAPQRVMVLAAGFAWNGNTYPSLSKVARAITGTRWNGPRFFGLRDQQGRDAALCRLHPRLDRLRSRARLQLARCAEGSRGCLCEEPSP
jgi:hypothetical protein